MDLLLFAHRDCCTVYMGRQYGDEGPIRPEFSTPRWDEKAGLLGGMR
jgi:hypothetical protein